MHYNAKQCRDSFQQQHSWDPFPILCSVAFRFSFVRSLLLDLNLYSGNDSNGMFPLFYKQVAGESAPKMAIIFRHLVKGGSFPACWRLGDVVPVSNKFSNSDVENYRQLEIVAENLSHFWIVTACCLLLSVCIEGAWAHLMFCSHCLPS